MDFGLTAEQSAIREGVKRICDGFDDDYWREHDQTGEFPDEFHQADGRGRLARHRHAGGVGGAGLGVTEAAIMMQTVAQLRRRRSPACSSIHLNIFGPHPIVVHGTPEQKQRMLPPLITGEEQACFGVTEPDAGLDTTQPQDARRARRRPATSSTAARSGPRPRSAPTRSCCSRAPRRTSKAQGRPTGCRCSTPTSTAARSRCADPEDGPPGGRVATCCSSTTARFPTEDRIGEEGKGFKYLLARPQSRAHAVRGRGDRPRPARAASARRTTPRSASCSAGRSARTRAIQHPLAESWAELEAADLMAYSAAALYDAGPAVRRGGQRREVSRRRSRLQRLRGARC